MSATAPTTTSITTGTAPALTVRRRWAALAVLMLPVILIAVDNTVLAFRAAGGSLRRSLPPGAEPLWIVDAYPLVLAGLLVPMELGDAASADAGSS